METNETIIISISEEMANAYYNRITALFDGLNSLERKGLMQTLYGQLGYHILYDYEVTEELQEIIPLTQNKL